MRIAFLGKGGSGKTTLSSLATRLAPELFTEIYAIDADINLHLAGALGRTHAQASALTPIYKYVEAAIRQARPELAELPSLPRTLPPYTDGDRLPLGFQVEPWRGLPHPSSTVLLELGSYSQETMGWSCHHGALGKLQLVLAHTQDSPEQLIIADLTAGADVFGVGMLGLFDMVFVAVEPTIKSMTIYQQLAELAAHDDVKLVPVGNKIIDETDTAFITAQLGQAPAYSIGMSNFVRRLERGEQLATSDIEPTTAMTVRQLLAAVAAHTRDDAAMRAAAVKAHIRAAQNWPKAKFPIDLLSLLPPQERPGA